MPQVTCSTSGIMGAIPGDLRSTGLTVTNTDSTNIGYIKAYNDDQSKITAANADFAIGPGLTVSIPVAFFGKQTACSMFGIICTAGTPILQWKRLYP